MMRQDQEKGAGKVNKEALRWARRRGDTTLVEEGSYIRRSAKKTQDKGKLQNTRLNLGTGTQQRESEGAKQRKQVKQAGKQVYAAGR